MHKVYKKLMLAGMTVVSAVALSAGPVFAQSSSQMYQANLQQLNGSGTTGTAMVEVTGNEAKVTVRTEGASAGLPHAQHLHIGGANTCPAPDADKDDDNLINTAEGQPSYGEVKVSLTTEGDTSADSALAVDRFPSASGEGIVTYERTFTLPEGVSGDDMKNAVVVQHGISKLFEDQAKYDGDKKSSLDDSLPLEATIPSACGTLSAAPVGGVSTGGGSTAGIENTGVLAIGAVAATMGTALLANRKFDFVKTTK